MFFIVVSLIGSNSTWKTERLANKLQIISTLEEEDHKRNEKNTVSLEKELSILAKIVLPIFLFWAFASHSNKLVEFDDRRSDIHG
ncbi:MAG: hypothetical protein U9O20_04880 [Patescibacteria group bacterium]|nr:hypothetical protein [Patescibacteria group bacterium]